MQITISRRQTLTFTPDGQGDIEEDKRFSLLLRPMSLAVEEDLMDGVFAKQAKGETYQGDAKLFNKVFRTHVIGWKNLDYDDGESASFDSEWTANGLPDDILTGFDMGLRTSVFTFLLAQAGMKGEAEVGKSA